MTYGVDEYQRRTPKGRAAWERAAKLIPGGVGSAIQFKQPYPMYIGDSRGSRVWDLDGNEYIDYSLCYAAMVAGHANPVIVEAIKRQAEHGTLYGLPTTLAGDLAEEIIRRYEGVIDMVRFTQSGVEATQTAIRLARAATGRKTIVKIEGQYHGGTDHLLVSIGGAPADAIGPDDHPRSTADSAGLLPASTEYTAVVQFNDLDQMGRAFDEHDGDVAGVIVEPAMTNGGVIPPLPGYLEGVRELCTRKGAVMIMDEVKLGCRIAPGGATEHWGVKGDVVTLAKAIGGGVPVGAFGGRRELMEQISPLGSAVHFGTYNANPLGMAAGLACLTKVMTDDAYKEMTRLTTRLADGMRDALKETGVAAHVVQVNTLGGIFFGLEGQPNNFREAAKNDTAKWDDYWFGMLNRGVIPMGSAWFEEFSMSAQHTDEDVDRTLQAFEDCLRAIA
ncbi:MAG: glutamate-1-semialdehyde 2,1-aminomutase [Actinobacteria bacterium]|nr:glutamate-1-semialdehyde 2,1-aminomutase [Actinomycetota bacterium]